MKKLFYVEPDQMLRVGFECVFKTSDWEIYTLDSMDDFDFRFKDFDPDILLLDSSFCNTGYLEKIKVVTTQIPVVFIGKEELEERSDCYFIKKPISLSDIIETIEGFLK
jgi:hypothetical protein